MISRSDLPSFTSPHLHKIQRWLTVVCLFALLAGCSSTLQRPDSSATPIELQQNRQAQASAATARGEVGLAAQIYQQLASQAESPERESYLLEAAAALVKGHYQEQAQQIIDTLPLTELNPTQQAQRQIIVARTALLNQQPGSANSALEVAFDNTISTALQIEIHHLRAEAYAASGNYLEAAGERIQLAPWLDSPESQHLNHQQIWSALTQISTTTLQTLSTQLNPEPLGGWLKLANIVKSAPEQPELFESQVTLWQQYYPDHPANSELLDQLLTTQNKLLDRPQQIALLLPLSDAFGAQAKAIRDGFLAAYYARKDHRYQPRLRIYDSGNRADQSIELYQQAVTEGADFIIGPLNKQAVKNLAQSAVLPVTTLALNYLEEMENRPLENFFQYGLSPEDEARQVAEKAWLDGHDHALALTPQGDWGGRMFSTFKLHWLQLGGNILEQQQYDPSQHDFSKPISELLNVDSSKNRFAALKRLLNRDIEFEPRRRQDTDFIFIAAFPRQARQIRPQLKFFYAAKLPVYSTSHLFSGGSNTTTQDRDMDGILFCDMPWMLRQPESRNTQPSWQSIEQEWPDSAPPYKRLYALGIDAYNLLPWLNYLQIYRHEQLSGETGNLYLDDNNRIHRQLIWARFRRGVPHLLGPDGA